jgi:hypothetical protein
MSNLSVWRFFEGVSSGGAWRGLVGVGGVPAIVADLD